MVKISRSWLKESTKLHAFKSKAGNFYLNFRAFHRDWHMMKSLIFLNQLIKIKKQVRESRK